MTDCKFGIADCTPLHRCEGERAEFDRLLLDVKTDSVPSPTMLRFKHCVQMVPAPVLERYDLTQPSAYLVLVATIAQMKAVAIKKSSREKAVGLQEMGTLRCDGCGEEFFIGHNLASGDRWVAEKQAKWLEKVLAEEHERDKKHPDRIELPE